MVLQCGAVLWEINDWLPNGVRVCACLSVCVSVCVCVYQYAWSVYYGTRNWLCLRMILRNRKVAINYFMISVVCHSLPCSFTAGCTNDKIPILIRHHMHPAREQHNIIWVLEQHILWCTIADFPPVFAVIGSCLVVMYCILNERV